jgi:hypothetical protein
MRVRLIRQDNKEHNDANTNLTPSQKHQQDRSDQEENKLAMTRKPSGSRGEQQAELTDHQAEKKVVIQNECFAEENVAISPKTVQNYDHSYPGQLDQYLTEEQEMEGYGRQLSLDDAMETSKRETRNDHHHHHHKKGHHHRRSGKDHHRHRHKVDERSRTLPRQHSIGEDHPRHSHIVDELTYPSQPCMS